VNHEKPYEIKDITLATKGQKRIDWAQANMPITVAIGNAFQKTRPFENKHIAICLHVEAKTAVWLGALQKGGATISITGSPGTTQDDTAAALVQNYGVSVFTKNEETYDDHLAHCKSILSFAPDLIADNGADLHHLIYNDPALKPLSKTLLGATEETTTGANRLRDEVGCSDFPTLIINDTQAKRIVENRFGVGSSVVDGIMRATNILLHGKTAVVVGYGYCGSGVAQRLRGMGAHVVVVDNNPLTKLEAHLDGFIVADLETALQTATLCVTVTGHSDVLNAAHFSIMRDGIIVANAGHFASEINEPALDQLATKKQALREHITEYTLADSKKVFLLCNGNPVNLSAGDGNPIEVMDLGLALQAMSLARLAEGKGDLTNIPQCVPEDIENFVVTEALKYWAS